MAERKEFIGRLIVAGPTRTMTGEANGYVVEAEAIRRAVAEGLFRGLACFADHAAGGESPAVRRLVGVWHDVVYDEADAAAVGRLRAYDTAETRPVVELLEQVLEEQGLDEAAGPDLGVSIVFYPQLAGDGRTVRGMAMVESADLVMFPASGGSRIVGRMTNDE
ncbi:protein of unknown function [Candidatus Promineifilum breve]|uniref:Uncharacterized protein n=1 Tax=Candidatus Promineifilum breve TaxID=1806508 RepID=A0A160T8Z7_9CHLR|nr:hypothetical protein [Candidatus Promineifilum breve]CUS06269.1 protein of unknown function [Candidatus Promineifilum breve]